MYLRGKGKRGGFAAKPGSHDDGGHHGPYLGGIGTGSFSRDIYGAFSRWSLQQGFHLHETIPQARLMSRYEVLTDTGSATGRFATGREALKQKRRDTRFVGVGEPPSWEGYSPSFTGFSEESREYSVLFPRVRERYKEASFPLLLDVSFWSPLVFYDYEAASLPVVFIDVNMKNLSTEALQGDIALFWPNLLGWRTALRTAIDQGGRSWPGQGHSGNENRAFSPEIGHGVDSAGGYGAELHGVGVVQGRHVEFPVSGDMEGEVALSVLGPEKASFSSQISMKADQNAIGIPAERQEYTQGWAEEYFARHGKLPETKETWTAHWHEPLSSAVHGGMELKPGETGRLYFTLVFDLPLTVFGDGRVWEKKYTEYFSADGRNSERISRYACEKRARWEGQISAQAREVADKTVLNELFFLTAGGSVWTRRERPGRERPSPLLGGGEHFGLLEAFDTGYYYYNTLDLWIYAFSAFVGTWPRLSDLVFEDYMKTVDMADTRRRIVYREMREKELLAASALPHDMGNPMEDPWHRLNGYVMRDDPNAWKDRNPSFIISTYLYKHLKKEDCSLWEWERLKKLGGTMTKNESGYGVLPRHEAFGDSTWDALQLRGLGIYSAGFTIAAYAALADMAEKRGEYELSRSYRMRCRDGVDTCEYELWNGGFYKTDSEGRYSSCIMTDALIGPYYASMAGLGSLLPEEHVRLHLRRVYEYNYLGYRGGSFGPLLVNNAESQRFSPDGGEELQINEVLVGSAWIFCAMLFHFGLPEEAEQVGEALRRVQYEEGGLAFRTPAAWDGEGRFRAPLNMRPLSIWWLHHGSR